MSFRFIAQNCSNLSEKAKLDFVNIIYSFAAKRGKWDTIGTTWKLFLQNFDLYKFIFPTFHFPIQPEAKGK